MSRDVTIALAWANNIPGVSGVEDVTLELVEADDIVDPAVARLPDEADIRSVVSDEINDALADGVLADIDGQLDIDVPGADVIADAVLDRLDVTPGLFGPIDDPLDEVIRRAVRNALEDLPELDVDLGGLGGDDLLDLPDVVDDLINDVEGLIDDVSGLGDRLDDLDVPGLEDIREVVDEALEEVGPEVDGAALFGEPVGFFEAVLENVTDGLVSDEAREDLQDALED